MVTRIVNAIGDAIGSIIAFIPALLAFLVVLGIGYLVAKGLQKLTDALLTRVGFNRLVERGGIKQMLERSQWDASDLMARGVFWVVMIFVLQLAFGVFGPNPVSAVLTGLIAYLPNVFAAGIILIVAAAVAAAVRDLVMAAVSGVSYGRTIANVLAIAIMVVAAFAALSQLRIAPAIVNGLFYAILVALAGVIVIAVGGSGIQPLREYWTRALDRAEREAPRLRQQTSGGTERMKEQAERRAQQIPVSQERRRVEVGGGSGMAPA